MHRTGTHAGLLAVAAAVLIGGAGAAATPAHGASVTVTGDDGKPVALSQGVPVTIRQMSPTVGIGFPAAYQGRFSATVTGPDGAPASAPLDCLTPFTAIRYPDYRGNGAYTITVVGYGREDVACRTPLSAEVYTFAINGGVVLGAPRGPFLIRRPNGARRTWLRLPVALNPGTSTYEVRYARGAAVGPDGAIAGPSEQSYVNTASAIAALTFAAPGTYTFVARAARGDHFTPWSPPVQVVALAPFDLRNLTFPDARGPHLRVRGEVREASTRGRISVAIAPGRKGNRYRSLGMVTLSPKATFTKRFTLRRSGWFRLRLRYAGSATTAGGTVVQRIRIARRPARAS